MPQMCPNCSRDNPDYTQTCAHCGELLRGLLGRNTILEGRYRVTRVLGCGGMGAVYLADDNRIQGRRVAVKENLSTTPQAQAQFQAEVSLMVGLSHPGLPDVSDQFIGPGGRQYIVMDYVEGETLEDIVDRRGSLPEAEVIALADQLLDVLEHLHSHSVIHRDVKPANVKITPSGKPVLVDFGIAKLHAPGLRTQTWGRGFGSPGFAPPEQYGAGTDARSDLYSLGAVMYFLLTGQVPPEAPELAAGTRLTPPRQLRSDLSSHVQSVIFKAMALNTAQRYQSAAEMRQALLGPPGPMVGVTSPPLPGAAVKPFRIALSCSLGEAQQKMLMEEWGGRIANIAEYIISGSKRVEGETILLRGYQGFGGTSIAQGVRERVRKELGDRLAAAWVDFSELGSTWESIRVLETVLGELRAGVETKKLKKAIDEIYQPLIGKVHFQDKSRKDEISLEIQSPIGIDIPLPGGGRLSIQFPIRYVRKTYIEKTAKGPFLERSAETLLRALMSLVEYFVARGVTVLLIFDRVDDLEILKQLYPVAARRGVFSVIIVDEDRYAQWEDQEEDILLWLARRKSFYMDCLWDMPRKLCRELTKGCPEADTEEFETFIRYIEFHGRGKPSWVHRAIDEFYEPPGKKWRRLPELVRDALQFILEEEDEPAYLHVKRSRVQTIQRDADLQRLLEDDGWNAIFFDKVHQTSMLDGLDPQKYDQAKLGVYKLVDWLKKKAPSGKFPKAELMEHARSVCHIPLPSDQVVKNLVTFLISQKKLVSTTRGLDASGMLRAPSVTARRGRMG
jgi:hypothetical protein